MVCFLPFPLVLPSPMHLRIPSAETQAVPISKAYFQNPIYRTETFQLNSEVLLSCSLCKQHEVGIWLILPQKEKNTGDKNSYYSCRDCQALNRTTVAPSKTKRQKTNKKTTASTDQQIKITFGFFFLVETLKLQLSKRKQEEGAAHLCTC